MIVSGSLKTYFYFCQVGGQGPYLLIQLVEELVPDDGLVRRPVLHHGETRVVLIDTFKDESEEAIRVAEALGDHLGAVRLDTPSERGGVSPELIREVRYRLDMAGFKHVKIVATGGLTPERIRVLAEAGADTFGVGSYICHGQKIDMTLDLKVVNGKPVAKRGRLPGPLDNPLLVRV